MLKYARYWRKNNSCQFFFYFDTIIALELFDQCTDWERIKINEEVQKKILRLNNNDNINNDNINGNVSQQSVRDPGLPI